MKIFPLRKRQIRAGLRIGLSFYLALSLMFAQTLPALSWIFSDLGSNQASAQESATWQQSLKLNFAPASHQLVIETLDTDSTLSFSLFYERDQILEAVGGEISAGQESLFLGGQSGDDYLEHHPERLILKISDGQEIFSAQIEPNYEVDETSELSYIGYASQDMDLSQSEQFWLASDWHRVDQVVVGETYNYPNNQQVSVTFRSLPDEPGDLRIREVRLSEEEAEELGALSTMAYEIKSNLSNGSFSYDLTLPKPLDVDQVGVVYSEDGENFADLKPAEMVGEERGEQSMVRMTGLDHFTVFVVTTVSPASDSPYCVSNTADSSTDCFENLQTAINTAPNNSTILIEEGTYPISQSVRVNKPLTIEGQSEDGVTLDLSSFATYGFDVTASDVTIKNLTIIPPATHNTAYTFKVSGTSYKPDFISNISLSNITVDGSYRTAFDFNGVNNVILSNLTATNTIRGNAISLTGVNGAHISNIQGFSNAWGGIAIYGSVNAERGSTNIYIEGSTIDLDAAIFIQDNSGAGLFSSDVEVADWPYRIYNSEWRAEAPDYEHFAPTADFAQQVAKGLNNPVGPSFFINQDSVIFNTDLDQWEVYEELSIQAAIDMADSADTVVVHDGIFTENININKALTLKNGSSPVLDGQNSGENVIYVTADDVTIQGFEIKNSGTAGADIAGIYLNNVKNTLIDNNYIHSNKNGVVLGYNSADNVIRRNVISNNSNHGIFGGGFAGNKNNVFEYNKLNNNASFGVFSKTGSAGLMFAAKNWWGSISGPSGQFSGIGDAVSTNVEYLEFMCSPDFENWLSVDGECISPPIPTQTGYNFNDGTPSSTPRDPNMIACLGGATNVNGVSVHWSDVSSESSDLSQYLKYRRQFKVGAGNWSGNEVYANPFTNYRSFGGGSGAEKVYGSRVQSFFDLNENGVLDANEPRSDWSNECFIQYDVTDPTIPTELTVTPTSPTNQISQTWSWTASTDIGGSGIFNYFYQILGVSSAFTQSGTTSDTSVTSNLLNGLYSFFVRAIDNAGNESADASIENYLVDTIPPSAPTNLRYSTASEELSCGQATSSYSIVARWDASTDNDQVKHYEYQSYNPPSGWLWGTPTTTSISRSGAFTVGEGVYGFRVRAVDLAGNKSAWSANSFEESCQIHYDITTPQSSITGPGEVDPNDQNTIVVSDWDGSVFGEATDQTPGQVAGVELEISRAIGEVVTYWDGSEWSSDPDSRVAAISGDNFANWNYQIPSPFSEDLVSGTYAVTSRAYDTAGNKESSAKLIIVLDREIPQVAISVNPTNPNGDNNWYKTRPTVTLTGSESFSGLKEIQYSWNNQAGPWTTYTGQFQIPAQGSYILYYRAINNADVASETGIKNLRWDETTLTQGPINVKANPSRTSGTTSTISWEAATDNISIDRYQIIWKLKAGGPEYNKSVSSSTRETEIDRMTEEGEWEVFVRAYDPVGNMKEGVALVTVVQTAPAAPTLTLAGTAIGSANLTWNAVENASRYIIYYGVNAGEYIFAASVGNTTAYTVEGLAADTYYFMVRAVDDVDNQSSNSNEVSTGAIAGAPGTTPGAGGTVPAAGFGPAGEVLGEDDDIDDETRAAGGLDADGNERSGVLGDTDTACGLVESYLPLILLLVMIIVLLVGEFGLRDRSSLKYLLSLGAPVLAIIIFYLLRDQECLSTVRWLGWLYTWFWVIALMVAGLIRLVGYAFLEEIGD